MSLNMFLFFFFFFQKRACSRLAAPYGKTKIVFFSKTQQYHFLFIGSSGKNH